MVWYLLCVETAKNGRVAVFVPCDFTAGGTFFFVYGRNGKWSREGCLARLEVTTSST
jgi:hypothetical protein